MVMTHISSFYAGLVTIQSNLPGLIQPVPAKPSNRLPNDTLNNGGYCD